MWKVRLLTASAGLAAALALPPSAAAQEYCGPIIGGPHYTITVVLLNGAINVPPRSEVRRDGCVCWKGGNVTKELKVWFWDGPFSADTLVANAPPWRVCDWATEPGEYFYKVSIDGIASDDPWLDVGG